MAVFKFANFVATELEEGISASATEMIVPVGATEALPTLGVDEIIRLVLWDGQQDPEIVSVTANPQSGVLTIVRGEEDTTAVTWAAGTQVRCVLTAAIINAALAAFFDLEAVLQESFLPLAGGTLTGNLLLPGPPTDGLHATTKAYVDEIGGSFLSTTGGSMIGNINMNSNQVLGLAAPSAGTAATSKTYVDNLISGVQGQIATGAAVHSTTGTSSAYVIDTGQAISVLSDGMAFIIRLHATNSANPTLKVDTTAAKPITVGGLGVTAALLIANTPYTVIYDATLDDWVLVSITNLTLLTAPIGTRMVFQQTTPPAGWTKETVHNNKALRLVSGAVTTGGSTAFTSVFGARTITQVNLPAVNLPGTSLTATESLTATPSLTASHSLAVGTAIDFGTLVYRGSAVHTNTPAGADRVGIPNNATSNNTLKLTSGVVSGTITIGGTIDIGGTIAMGGTVPLGGSGTAMDFAVQYVDFTIGVKT